MEQQADELEAKARLAHDATWPLAFLSTSVKNRVLKTVAAGLHEETERIIEANREDYAAAKASGMSESMLDRLLLDEPRIAAMSADVLTIAALPDPIGQEFDSRRLSNGLQLSKRRVPLGVIAAIYESRPNVTIDISSLCIKSGNACILRGGKEALRSNRALASIVQQACRMEGVPEGAVQFIESTDRALVNRLLGMREYIDLVIPRGGAALIRLVAENATMAVVTGGIGVCHAFVDCTADLEMALRIVNNAKVQRPTVCNALDCVLVHNQIAPSFIPALRDMWRAAGVEMRCDVTALSILGGAEPGLVMAATSEDWGKEFLSLVAAIRVVPDLNTALEHIRTYGSGHSEAIITQDYAASLRFQQEVDAACVYVNASTRFTDGSQFGLGAEIGISTQKFHARGPMALEEITSYKWVALGDGQIRE